MFAEVFARVCSVTGSATTNEDNSNNTMLWLVEPIDVGIEIRKSTMSRTIDMRIYMYL